MPGEKVAAEIEWLAELGLRPKELDLRSYCEGGRFGEDLRARLTQYDGCGSAAATSSYCGSPVIVPHLNSPGHPETELVEKVQELYQRTGVLHLPMRDGQALVIDGAARELV